MRTPST